MSDYKQKTNIIVWVLIIATCLAFIIIDAMFFNWALWVWIPVSILILIGCVISFSQYFIDPKKHCPRCNTEVPSIYTQNCPNCGLKLITKCLDCGKYISVYQSGKPSKYCNQCGLELDLREVKIEIIENPYVREEKVRFCPNCGVGIEEENVRYCALCGGKID